MFGFSFGAVSARVFGKVSNSFSNEFCKMNVSISIGTKQLTQKLPPIVTPLHIIGSGFGRQTDERLLMPTFPVDNNPFSQKN